MVSADVVVFVAFALNVKVVPTIAVTCAPGGMYLKVSVNVMPTEIPVVDDTLVTVFEPEVTFPVNVTWLGET